MQYSDTRWWHRGNHHDSFSSGGVSLNLKVQGAPSENSNWVFMGQVMETYTILLAVFKRTHGPALLMTLAFCGYIVRLKRNWHTTSLMRMAHTVAKPTSVCHRVPSMHKHHHRSLNFRKLGQDLAEQLLVALVIKQ